MLTKASRDVLIIVVFPLYTWGTPIFINLDGLQTTLHTQIKKRILSVTY